MGLKEYFILKPQFESRPSDSFLGSFNQTITDLYGGNRNDNSDLKMVSLDDVTSYMFNTFEKYGTAWKTNKLDNPKDYNNKLKEVRDLVNERARLDNYFTIPGHRIEIIRVHMLKLIIKLQNDGFVREINKMNTEMNFDYPSIEDILLKLFVSCVREYDDYYLANIDAGRNILIKNTWEVPKKTDMEFYICKSTGGRLTGIVNNQKFEKTFDLEGIFSTMVLFVHNIKKMHSGYINPKKVNAFNDLLKTFDISDERYLE